jgi:hemoglobin
MKLPVISDYERIGGEEKIRALVERFYDLMDSLPEAAELRALHAKDLRVSRRKLFEFLSGWMGGPPLYEEKYGHPRLRQRHLPFTVGTKERDQWMLCMEQAMRDIGLESELQTHLRQAFWRTADFMRNQN